MPGPATETSLLEMDARKLDYPDDTFDILYNGYMLDLIPLADMTPILSEFRRVLKPGGRLVLLNMSKRDDQSLSGRERLYGKLPATLVLYLMGCLGRKMPSAQGSSGQPE